MIAVTATAMIGMIAFSGFLLLEKHGVASQTSALGDLAEMGPVVSALVHELQKERGMSAGFIGSKGKQFARQLPGQRQSTDGKRAALGKALEAVDTRSYGSRLVATGDTLVLTEDPFAVDIAGHARIMQDSLMAESDSAR